MTRTTYSEGTNRIILIDGECPLCHRLAKFVSKRDAAGKFRFAALRSAAGRRLLAEGERDASIRHPSAVIPDHILASNLGSNAASNTASNAASNTASNFASKSTSKSTSNSASNSASISANNTASNFASNFASKSASDSSSYSASKSTIIYTSKSNRKFDNTLVLIEEGRYYAKSTAALRVLRQLDGLWPLAYAAIALPAFLRDGVYDLIAGRRYRFNGCGPTLCELQDVYLRDRLLSEGEASE